MRLRCAWRFLLRFGCGMMAIFVGVNIAVGKDYAPYNFDRFFDPKHLVEIELTIVEADWDVLRLQHRSLLKTMRTDVLPTDQEKQFDYFPALLTIDGVELGKVAVRKKGFVGSMDDHRPSLKIQLDRYDKKKKFAEVDTLTLNNNKQDPSDIHQVIGYQVFRSAGLPASHCNFATVRVNGKHLGIYCNVESPDKRFARRHFGNDKGAFYEGTIADFTKQAAIRFERKFGSKKWDEKIQEVIAALEADDEALMDQLGAVVDLDRFFRFWALESLLGHWDGYVSNKNNYFLYVDPDRDRIDFLPWGIDQLGEDQNMFWGGYQGPKSVKADGAVARRLYETPAGQERYFATLEELLDTVWDEDALLETIAQLQELIEPHVKHSGERYRHAGEDLDEFVKGRRDDLEAELEKGFPKWELGDRGSMGRVEKWGDCTLTFAFRMGERDDDSKGFTEGDDIDAEASLWMGDDRVPFDVAEIGVRENPSWGRRGKSYSIQFSRSDGDGKTPSTIEVSFPEWARHSSVPVRVDVFASPGSGRLLNQKGNVAEEGTLGMMTGTVNLGEFGTEAGASVNGVLKAEIYRMLPD